MHITDTFCVSETPNNWNATEGDVRKMLKAGKSKMTMEKMEAKEREKEEKLKGTCSSV